MLNLEWGVKRFLRLWHSGSHARWLNAAVLLETCIIVSASHRQCGRGHQRYSQHTLLGKPQKPLDQPTQFNWAVASAPKPPIGCWTAFAGPCQDVSSDPSRPLRQQNAAEAPSR